MFIHNTYMVCDPVNTNDYHIPHVKPKPAKPTHSFVDVPKPATVEVIKEEPEHESAQQACGEEGINVISVEKNLPAENKQCINNHSSTIPKESSFTKPHSNPQISNSYSDTEQAQKQAMELPQADNMDQSSHVQGISSLLAASDKQKGVGSHCIIVKAEIHNS